MLTQPAIKASGYIRRMSISQIELFAGKYAQTYGCWDWYGYTSKDGYGYVTIVPIDTKGKRDRHPVPTHRVMYELVNGYCGDEKLYVDHLCRNRRCLRPDHLELVTPKVNTLRGKNPAAKNARKTHCIRGHKFTSDNLYDRKDGTRNCRKCSKIHWKNYKERNKK